MGRVRIGKSRERANTQTQTFRHTEKRREKRRQRELVPLPIANGIHMIRLRSWPLRRRTKCAARRLRRSFCRSRQHILRSLLCATFVRRSLRRLCSNTRNTMLQDRRPRKVLTSTTTTATTTRGDYCGRIALVLLFLLSAGCLRRWEADLLNNSAPVQRTLAQHSRDKQIS